MRFYLFKGMAFENHRVVHHHRKNRALCFEINIDQALEKLRANKGEGGPSG